jgi:hypothetical protein
MGCPELTTISHLFLAFTQVSPSLFVQAYYNRGAGSFGAGTATTGAH